jgi:hypothetical protein
VGAGRGLRGRDGGSDVTNVRYKLIWNCYYESPLYNECILIKKRFFLSIINENGDSFRKKVKIEGRFRQENLRLSAHDGYLPILGNRWM